MITRATASILVAVTRASALDLANLKGFFIGFPFGGHRCSDSQFTLIFWDYRRKGPLFQKNGRKGDLRYNQFEMKKPGADAGTSSISTPDCPTLLVHQQFCEAPRIG